MNTELRRDNRLRVVLDTNVIVSGVNFFGGNEFQGLLLAFQGRINLYLSPSILAEVEEILRTKFRWPAGRLERTLALLQEWATVVQPTVEVTAVEGDEDDNRILECCLECNAQYLVTGDQRDLLPLQTIQGTRIINAATFLREFVALELLG
jgi:uncharacterized protein